MKTYNLLLHCKQTNCDSMLSPILALFARISKPLWLNICYTGAEVAGGEKTFLAMDASQSVPSPKTETETETRGFQDQDQDQHLRLKTKTETKTCKNGSPDQDSSLENSKSGRRLHLTEIKSLR